MPGTWSRLEGNARTADIEVGLRAELADPLWLIGRQAQFGEFVGEDGGSPVGIDLAASWSRLTRFHAGAVRPSTDATSGSVDFDSRTMVLEAMVEAERGSRAADLGRAWDDRARTGRRFEAMLSRAGETGAVATARALYPFPDALSEQAGTTDTRWAAVLGGTLTDGLAAALDTRARGGPHPDLLGSASDPTAMTQAIGEWLDWATMHAVTDLDVDSEATSPSWDPARLEYAFAVSAPPLPGSQTEVVLGAAEYDGTGVDWFSLDVVPDASLGASAADGDVGTSIRHLLPTLARYQGMPNDRYWELEDGRVNLGAVSAGPTDLARMLAIEYAVTYGPDWFVVPLDLPVGTVARIDWVVVKDTFGVATVVGTAQSQGEDRAGRQFQPGAMSASGAQPDPVPADIPLLVVLPSALGPIRGEVLERIDIQRDEMANLAWGIEQRSLGPSGRGRIRGDRRPEPMTQPADPSGAELLWRLATSVPRSWLPLAPVRTGDNLDGRVEFRAAEFVDAVEASPRTFGQLLSEIDVLAEEEITRAGLRVELFDQLARAVDGTVIVWRGRERTVGRGEVDSQLRWDASTPL